MAIFIGSSSILALLVIIIFGLLVLRRTEPTGCIIYFGSLGLLILLMLIFGPSVILSLIG